uniref:Wiskott-Aldrich syndrome protein family member n=1 Tax=Panagrolaimus superbus TaxID=310955 RepID=A0A914Z311_9BILA
MPLAARSVTPVDIAQGRLPPGVKGDVLECVANGTMANLMRQMSSLGLHAVQIFGDIHKEVSAQDQRIERIHDRLSRLQENLANQQDFPQPPFSSSFEMEGRRKAFKSAMVIDQHTLDRSTLPPAMLELYNKCEDPPNLDLLNPYRDDSKSALKLYTNPEYFFDLWKEEMLKEDPAVETRRMAKSARSPDRDGSPTKKRKQRTSTSATRNHQAPIQSNVVLGHYQQQQRMQQQQNEEFMHFPSEYQAPELLRSNNISYGNEMPPPPGMSMPTQPTRIAPGRPTQQQQQQHSRDMITNFQGLNLAQSNDLGLIDEDDDELPPPPPPLSDHTSLLPNLNSPSAYSSTSTMPMMTAISGSPMKLIEAPAATPPSNGNDILPPPPTSLSSTVMVGSSAPPPPPPPPPPPLSSVTLMTSSTLIQATSFGNSSTTATDTAGKEGSGGNVIRGNLLAEIQAGMKLKKIQIQKEKEEEAAAVEKNDVAAILRQRMKKVTTSISDDEDDDDDEEWN